MNCFPDKAIWIFLISFLVWHVRSDDTLHAFHAKTFLNISYTCWVPNPSLALLTLHSNFTEKTQDNQSRLCWLTRNLSLPLLKSSLCSLTSSFSFCILDKETSPHHSKSNSSLQVLWFHYSSLVLSSKPVHLSFPLFHV